MSWWRDGSFLASSAISPASILDYIRSVGEGEASVGRGLLKREWRILHGDERHFDDRKGSIRVMQFNVLAEGLSSLPSDDPPSSSCHAPSTGGGFTSLQSPEILNFQRRKVRLLEEIISHDPDVIAIEECDNYHGFFKPVLAKLGYESVFQVSRRKIENLFVLQ